MQIILNGFNKIKSTAPNELLIHTNKHQIKNSLHRKSILNNNLISIATLKNDTRFVSVRAQLIATLASPEIWTWQIISHYHMSYYDQGPYGFTCAA